MKRIVNTRPYLYAELAFLMLGLPLLLSTLIPLRYMLPVIWGTALYCHIIYRAVVDVPENVSWRSSKVKWRFLKPMLVRFAGCAVLASLFVMLWRPGIFLNLICERPKLWLMVMVFYPLASVIPQEIIFRSFFFQRYRPIFKTDRLMIIASGLVFGAAHLIFQNWVAPLMCVVGGLIFAQTYAKTRSLALVSIEHALYGCMMFTVGLGTYFYHGAVYSTHEIKVSPSCAYIGERVESLRSHLF